MDSTTELELVEALREGDEAAFAELVDRYHGSLVRVARLYVRDGATAEEVAQETWLAVLGGIDRFEARSSVKTWLFRILTNRAKTRGEREARSIPFSAMSDGHGPAAEAEEQPELTPGTWRSWEGDPEERLLAGEARELILATIETLPPAQRATITLRDIEGMSAEDVCNVLEVSDTNQRVLLHRARSTVRRALERYLGETENS
ncbi:MAG TPA: sigma-70 family RNA polymerase sigma factor [Thermoleophilaceae bacterium]|nr:sigma-70 family RNA polymerase sigma factor [Thermoleophilaceae bacterium]